MLSWRKYQPSDYELISGWFIGHGWDAKGVPPQEFLPATGMIVEIEGKPAAVGFLYLTNSSLGVLEWTATDPTLGIMGFKALGYLIDHLMVAARDCNMKAVMHFTKPEIAKHFARRLGFTCVEDATILIREVG